MKIQDVKDKVTLELGDHFKEKGFSLKKANFEFVKKINKNNAIFWIGIHAKTEWFLVNPSVFLGCPQVNKIYNSALGIKSPLSGSTCGYGIGNRFEHKRGRYSVDDVQSLSETIVHLRKDFDEIALPWFDEVNTIETVDRYMNSRQDGKFKPMSVSNACKGLIAAKLVKNLLFEEIFKDYYEFCVNAQSPKLSEPIKVVKKYLDEM